MLLVMPQPRFHAPSMAAIDAAKAVDAAKALANEAFARGDYLQAYNEYSSGLSAEPTNVGLLNNRAASCMKMRWYELAIDDARKAAACSVATPQIVKSHYRLASALHAAGQSAEAQTVIKDTLEISPGHAQLVALLAQVEAATGGSSSSSSSAPSITSGGMKVTMSRRRGGGYAADAQERQPSVELQQQRQKEEEEEKRAASGAIQADAVECNATGALTLTNNVVLVRPSGETLNGGEARGRYVSTEGGGGGTSSDGGRQVFGRWISDGRLELEQCCQASEGPHPMYPRSWGEYPRIWKLQLQACHVSATKQTWTLVGASGYDGYETSRLAESGLLLEPPSPTPPSPDDGTSGAQNGTVRMELEFLYEGDGL